MKYLSEYRNPETAKKLLHAIESICTQPWNIMEVCGGQTHSIIKHGLDQLLPDTVNLIHGPGCPVCVTPLNQIDKALAIAALPQVIFCSFGDMLRVPGSNQDLLGLKALGADIRSVYSPLDALQLAQRTTNKEVVFFGVGFETTAPTVAMAIHQAKALNCPNFSVLVSHVRVPPVMEMLLQSKDNSVQGFLGAGHVCSIMGYHEYIPIAEQHRVPIVITGFEPVDILQGLYLCIKQLQQGHFEVENQYRRIVKQQGNQAAQQLMQQVFSVVDQTWRGLGVVPNSGMRIADAYADWDAELKFDLPCLSHETSTRCQSGKILQGLIKPKGCPEFGNACTPEHPLGATMVSSEGACAAYYRYRKHG